MVRYYQLFAHLLARQRHQRARHPALKTQQKISGQLTSHDTYSRLGIPGYTNTASTVRGRWRWRSW